MGCIGGCVGGPKTLISSENGRKAVDEFASDSPIKFPLHSETLIKVLKDIDINSIDDFLNKKNMLIFERNFNDNN